MTKLAPTVTSAVRIIGGHTKTKLRSADIINVVDPATKTAKKAKIETVVDNPANRNFVRRNILTKGSIVQTDLGKVRITSRPGQDNVLNGVLTN